MWSPKESASLHTRVQAQSAFSMMELMFAVAAFSAFAVITILSFTTFNRFASNARYETLALSVAQEHVDEIMTVPCNTNSTPNLGPVLSMTGTTVAPNSSNVYTSGTETSLPLNNDPYNLTRKTTLSGTSPLALTALLTGTIVAGSLDTQVIDTRVTTFAPVSSNTRLLSFTVTVTYTYRGNHFSVSMSGVRSTDNF
jgi:type II secretory pathway pseudopilin PulG